MRDIFDGTDASDIKSVDDLAKEFSRYVTQIILNIFHGVARNLGVANPDALSMRLQKASSFLGGLLSVAQKIKGYLGRQIKSPFKPFTINGMSLRRPDGRPVTNKEWNQFNKQVTNYMRPYMDSVSEEMAVKTVLLGLAMAEAERQQKNASRKSYEQTEQEQFAGYIPDNLRSAKDRIKINKNIEHLMIQAHSRIADHVQKVDQIVRTAIREQVQAGIRQNKPWREIASDLYWMKDTRPELKRFTAESLSRDWERIAKTETAAIATDGKLAALELQAKQSISNPKMAVYYVFHGGDCDWCAPKQGTIVRHLPNELIGDEADDRLSVRGIKDPYTDIAVWLGKSNVGYPKAKWRICSPAHPWCRCRYSRIYPDAQEWDEIGQRIRNKSEKDFEKYVPPQMLKEIQTTEAANVLRREKQAADRMKGEHKKDADYYRDEMQARTKQLIGMDDHGGRIVQLENGQRYVEVGENRINDELAAWRNNRARPIPVSPKSTNFAAIFGDI